MASSSARQSHNVIALTVLALLAEQPCHPYEMQRLMRERHKDFAIGKTRSFYDAVNRLVRSRLVEPAETSRDGHYPERTVYKITEAGRAELASWLDELLSTPVTEYPLFNVAVSLIGALPPAAALQALQHRIVALQSSVATLAAVQSQLQVELHLPRLVLLEVEHIRTLLQAELEWVRSVVEDIQTGRLASDLNPEWSASDGNGTHA